MFQKKYFFLHKSLLLATLTLETAFCINACEVHDYWSIPDALVVNESQDRDDAERLETDLFVRYQLDYSVTNTSSNMTEVVVSGTSYVNNTARTTGMKVWRLNPKETGEGILTPTMLEYGNALQVSLLCCNQSKCKRNEVLCPVESDTPEGINAGSNHSVFCYQACQDVDRCNAACPAQSACESYCKKNYPANKQEQCMEFDCSISGLVNSCEQICDGDEDCLETCKPALSCAHACSSSAAACYKNCISTWSLCTDTTYSSDANIVPCSLCAKDLESPTACLYNKTPQWNEGTPVFSLHKADKSSDIVYTCDNSYNCDVYPSVCIDDCNAIFSSGSDALRAKCVDKCIEQHLFWCNDFYVPSEYIDSNYDQPCCYEEACTAEMQGIIKTMDVECFDDSACGSNHYCSPAGVCTENGVSSCSTHTLRNTPFDLPLPLLLFFGVIPWYTFKRRHDRIK